MSRSRWVALALLLALAVAAMALISRLFEKPAKRVVLISIDTLHAGHLGCYGYTRIGTPNIDRLAREGVLFENAVTTTPLTLPAHASIFTGRSPLRHGVVDNFLSYLDEREDTLAEVLKARGFSTAGFVGSFVLDSRWGVGQGFETYFDDFEALQGDASTVEGNERPGNEVLKAALDWIRRQGDQPMFAFVHFFDPHAPYEAPEPFRRKYGDDDVGRYDGEVAFVDSLVGELVSDLESRHLYGDTLLVLLGDHGESLGEHRESTHGFFVYDATIRVPLIMKAPGIRGGRRVRAEVRTVDVLPTVLDLLGVPAPSSVDGVSLRPLLRNPGEDPALVAYIESQYPRLHFGWAPLVGLRDRRYKFIDTPRRELYDLQSDPAETRNIAGEHPEIVSRFASILEGLEAERPPKSRSQSVADPETLERLRSLGYVTSWSAAEAGSGVLADPTEKIDLFNRIAEAREASQRGEKDRAIALLSSVLEEDPGIVLAYLMLGNIHLERGAFYEAETIFRAALSREDRNLEAIYGLALAYKGLGLWEKAVSWLERCLELEPRQTRARYKLAEVRLAQNLPHETERVLLEVPVAERDASDQLLLARAMMAQGKREGALAILHQVESEHPATEQVVLSLGNLFMEAGEEEAALRSYQYALDLPGETGVSIGAADAEIYNALGKILADRGDQEGSARAFQKAVTRNPHSVPGYNNLGIALARLGKLPEAERAFLQAIEKGPGYAEAYNNLGFLYLQTGSAREAIRLFRRALELKPDYPEAQANLKAALSVSPAKR